MKRNAATQSPSTGISDTSCPVKKMTKDSDLESLFNNLDYSDDFSLFTDIDFGTMNFETIEGVDNTFRETSPSSSVASVLENHRVCMKDIGNSFYLCCEYFQKTVKVHIRKFQRSSETEPLKATRSGVCMSLKTWYRFVRKIWDFNLIYTTSSFVADNALLVLNRDDSMLLQDMKTMQLISLDEYQLKLLKDVIHDFNDSVLDFLISKYLPSLISSKSSPSEQCQEENIVLDGRIISLIETSLSRIFRTEYECLGCISECSGQLRHMCMTMRELEKLQQMEDYVLFLLDFNELSKDFVQQTSSVSIDFLNNFNTKIICSVLFKTPNDV